MRQPVQPRGCPRAIAPPLGLTLDTSSPSSWHNKREAKNSGSRGNRQPRRALGNPQPYHPSGRGVTSQSQERLKSSPLHQEKNACQVGSPSIFGKLTRIHEPGTSSGMAELVPLRLPSRPRITAAFPHPLPPSNPTPSAPLLALDLHQRVTMVITICS